MRICEAKWTMVWDEGTRVDTTSTSHVFCPPPPLMRHGCVWVPQIGRGVPTILLKTRMQGWVAVLGMGLVKVGAMRGRAYCNVTPTDCHTIILRPHTDSYPTPASPLASPSSCCSSMACPRRARSGPGRGASSGSLARQG